MAGKGSKPRPMSVSKDKFSDNWDAIFAKKEDVAVKENKIITEDEIQQDKSVDTGC